ncbi:YcxB family protein [Hydrogenimonas sp.]
MSDVWVEVLWDEATFLEGAKIAYDYDMGRGWRRYLGWAFVALVQFGVVGALLHGSFGLLFISTLLVLYWYFLRWPMRKAALKRYFRRHPYAGRRLRFVVSDGGLCVDDRCVPWENFQRLIASPKGYLLDMGEAFLYLPKRAFNSDEAKAAFFEAFKTHIPNIVKVEG